MMKSVVYLLIFYQVLILVYFLLLNSGYTFITLFAFGFIRRSADAAADLEGLQRDLALSNLRPISIVIPAFNEELNIASTVFAATKIQYPEFEVIVVNDGSNDGTLQALKDRFDLKEIRRPASIKLKSVPVRAVYVSGNHPNVWVLDKENGGKADALNAGLSYSRFPLFCTIDADSILETDALLRMGQQFLLNKELIAAGGAVRVLNGCEVRNSSVVKIKAPRSILANIQIAEYLRAFMAGRVAFGEIDSLLIISGAFGIFRKDLVLAINGFRRTVGEDMDLILRLHRHCVDEGIRYKVYYIPEPVCWTQVPGDLLSLVRQRNRWQRGLFDSIWHNRIMLFNPKYGKPGVIGMPYFLIAELCGPIIEFIGYFGFVLFLIFHLVSPVFATLFFVVSILWGMWLNASAVLLDNFVIHRYQKLADSYKIALLGSLEYLGYRQLVAVERLVATFQVWHSHWGSMNRKPIQGDTSGE